jgi:hypothetical protein
MTVTERRLSPVYGEQHRTEEEPMLTTTSRQTRYNLHHRMLVNLAAAAWVATLMISAYYVFSVLATVS